MFGQAHILQRLMQFSYFQYPMAFSLNLLMRLLLLDGDIFIQNFIRFKVLYYIIII